MKDTSDLLTVKRFAEMQRVTRGYIYQLIDAEKLPVVIISGVKFIEAKYLKFHN